MTRIGIVSLFLLAAATCGPAFAATLSVPQDYPTIQEALDDASSGDQVSVAAGLYEENLVWPRRSGIRLSGAGASETIIDGQGIDRVITFPHTGFFTTNTTIEGFTITGGKAIGPLKWGGGIWLAAVRATVQDCIISGNHASLGGGILCQGHSTFRRLVVWGNEATTKGGGILLAGGGLTVDHCSFSYNTADLGPGVYFSAVSTTSFSNSVISGNIGEIPGTEYVIHDPYPPAGPLFMEYNDLLPGVPQEFEPVVLGEGNFSASPQFTDRELGNLGPLSTSPLIDNGSPNSPLDPDGTRADIGAIYFDQDATSGIEEGASALSSGLQQNWPNPFRTETRIRFNLSEAGPATLIVSNVEGRQVAKLSHGRMEAGAHEVSWDGRDGAGNEVASGVYFYKLATQVSTQTRVMILAR